MGVFVLCLIAAIPAVSLIDMVLNVGLGAALAQGSAFPTASTTGVSDCREARALTFGRSVNRDGTVIENEDITGTLTIAARNVRLRCVQINAGGALYGVNCFTPVGCPGLQAEQVEVYNCGSACVTSQGSHGEPAVWRRLHLHASRTDLFKAGSHTRLLDSYLQDSYAPTPTSHNDAAQVTQGRDIVLQGNRIEGPRQSQTSAILIKADQGEISDVQIVGNVLSGGSFTLYVRAGLFPMPSGVRVLGNVFVRESSTFGALSTDATQVRCLTWQGNRYDGGGLFALAPPLACVEAGSEPMPPYALQWAR